jgi:uncharacterized membrane protein (DUF4010 family)
VNLPDAFLHLAAALGCGFILGLERGWHDRSEGSGRSLAGVRTFSLISLMGGLLALLAGGRQPGPPELPGAAILVAGLLAVMAAATAMKAVGARDIHRYGATTIVAVGIAYAVGAIAVAGDVRIAVAAATAAAIILNSKQWLHGFVASLSEAEVRSALRLLAMSAILLPILPNRGYGPEGALNPFEIWLIVVLISAMSFAGYVAMKVVGPRRGPLVAAALGGLVSSTAVTLALARTARHAPASAAASATGVGVASAMMFARMGVVGVIVAPSLAGLLALALAPPALGSLIVAAIGWRRGGETERAEAAASAPANPFDLSMALRFGALLAAVTLAVTLARDLVDGAGLYGVAFLAGLGDVDAATLTFARSTASGGIEAGRAAIAIGVVGLSDTLFKAGMVLAMAGSGGRRQLAAPLLASAGIGLLVLAWMAAAP